MDPSSIPSTLSTEPLNDAASGKSVADPFDNKDHVVRLDELGPSIEQQLEFKRLEIAKLQLQLDLKKADKPTSLYIDDKAQDSHVSQRSSVIHAIKLPHFELMSFNGDHLKYHSFMSQFDQNIASQVSNPATLLQYLLYYCRGRARTLVESCTDYEAEYGYQYARDLLKKHCGQDHVVANAYTEKLYQRLRTARFDAESLMDLCVEMTAGLTKLRGTNRMIYLDSPVNLNRMVQTLPDNLHRKWLNKTFKARKNGLQPVFEDLVDLISTEAQILSSEYRRPEQNRRSAPPKTNDQRPRGIFAIGATESTQSCPLCAGPHQLPECQTFKKQGVHERYDSARRHNLCFICLRATHLAKDCDQRTACGQFGCNRFHHGLLHYDSRPKTARRTTTTARATLPAAASKPTPTNALTTATLPASNLDLKPNSDSQPLICSLHGQKCRSTRLGILPVGVLTPKGKLFTYAFIDLGSDVSLITREFLIEAGLEAKHPAGMTIKSFHGTSDCDSVASNVTLLNMQGTSEVLMEKAYVVDDMPMQTVPSIKQLVARWPHLRGIPFDELPSRSVSLLIGADVQEAHQRLDDRFGERGQPFAIESRLGWTVHGPLQQIFNGIGEVNCLCGSGPDIEEQLRHMYNREFGDTAEQATCSVSDIYVQQRIEASAVFIDGRYQVPIPWKQNIIPESNSRQLARKRLEQLRRRLLRDDDLRRKYHAIIQSYLEKDYVERSDGYSPHQERVWYIPHHPVLHPHKPGKVRIVFDCAARTQKGALNDWIHQGPDLINSLVKVLIKFRSEAIAVVADVEEMFLRVKVPRVDRPALSFLWYEEGDLNREPIEFRWSSHPFGVTSSPFCAAYALRRTATDFGSDYSPVTTDAIYSSFYVDDCLTSFRDVEAARKFTNEIRSLLARAGFRLRNWLSNDKRVLSSIPITERSSGVKDLRDDSLPSERALGIQWDSEEDNLTFDLKLPDRPCTRRGVLSSLSSLFDPLGFVAPWLLPGKLFMQELCKRGLSWDEPLCGELVKEWDTWSSNLAALRPFKIRRCMQPPGGFMYKFADLHIFCDASERAYAAVAYIRFEDEEGKVHCSLLFAKSRVAPLKSVSIPRLELTAATLAARIGHILLSGLDGYFRHVCYWSDSAIMLHCLNNQSKRFNIFAANRLSLILEMTSASQWRHVPSEQNAADIASRGSLDLTQLRKWLDGPSFLWANESQWPANLVLKNCNTAVFAREAAQVYTLSVQDTFGGLFSRVTDWLKLQRIVAWMKKFGTKTKTERAKDKVLSPLTVGDLERATKSLLHVVQEQCFPNATSQSRINPLRGLTPIVRNGLLCVGGRLVYSRLSDDQKFPIILPGRHPVTDAIIRFHHAAEGHTGQMQVLNSIRRKYWIIGGNAAVRRVLRDCRSCRRHTAKSGEQLMASLPSCRVSEGWYPFKSVGVDYFGPFRVKRGRSIEKWYGCLFTCLKSRAVHLECADSLSTNSFINCLIRFVSRRGKPEHIYSDNGTNFVGTVRELRQFVRQWDQHTIADHLTSKAIDWRFNAPHSSHRGGVWERMIRSTRRILLSIMKEQVLTIEQLQTFLIRAESILNNRPLVPISSDWRDPLALTPNSLLNVSDPGLNVVGVDMAERYRKGWQQVNYLVGVFWKRWTREYLPTLQRRTTWLRRCRDFVVGDVVLVCSKELRRELWPLGLIQAVHPSEDGHVRSVDVKTKDGVFLRDIRSLCLLEGVGAS